MTFKEQLNPYLFGSELIRQLTMLPEYNENAETIEERLESLLDVYKIYIPSTDTIDVYNRLYFSLLESLNKKDSIEETKLLNDNFRSSRGLKRYGVIGGLESFRISGLSGVGKSSMIQRCGEIITGNKILIREAPYREIIPILYVESVADASFKSILYSILEQIDLRIGTNYLTANKRVTTTVDMLLSSVSNVLINHVGLLVIDECERFANDTKKGSTLLNYLTQLVNQCNISICFVGNDSINDYFKNKEYLSRRTTGISIKRMEYNNFFKSFCEILFKYQYTKLKINLDNEILNLLYRLTGGSVSMMIGLFVETQRNAIIGGENSINERLLIDTFDKYFSNMHPYLTMDEIRYENRKKPSVNNIAASNSCVDNLITQTFKLNKNETELAIQRLSQIIRIETIILC